MADIPIHEMFHTWQGEGVYMGRNAFFVRTYGCPVGCDFCDSAGTWHPDFKPKELNRYSPEFLAREAELSGARFCVVTGGEPAIHDLAPMAAALSQTHIAFHIETSGAVPRKGHYCPDWTTLSPKWAKLPQQEWWDLADELKLIITDPEEIWRWVILCHQKLPARSRRIPVWLHPEWSKAKDAAVLKAITEAVKNASHTYLGMELRAGYQLHKLYKADELDPRSAPHVPLGGKENSNSPMGPEGPVGMPQPVDGETDEQHFQRRKKAVEHSEKYYAKYPPQTGGI